MRHRTYMSTKQFADAGHTVPYAGRPGGVARRLLLILLLLGAASAAGYYWWTRPPGPVVEGPRVEPEKIKGQEYVVLEGRDLARQQLLAGLAYFPGQGFPASLSLAPLALAGAQQKDLFPLESLLHYNPVLFLEECLAKYEREVKGYSATFIKQERVAEKLQPKEKLETHFREAPFSAYMKWIEGARLAQSVLYVEGENNNMMVAKPRGLGFFTVSRDPTGADAKATSRYSIKEFGIHIGAKRTVAMMRAAEARGALHIRYEGQVKVPELNHRACYKFVRTPYHPPEDEGINELTLYIDTEMLLQTGSVLRDTKGELIAEYFFADVRLNPEFKENQFKKAGL
jgi:hypothetical protein